MVITGCILSGRWIGRKCVATGKAIYCRHTWSQVQCVTVALLWFSQAGRQSWITAYYYDLLTQTFVGEKVLPKR